MHVGIARIALRIPHSHSLKERRQAARSIANRIRGRFNVSAAQDAADDGDAWQSFTLLLSCVSSDPNHADALLSQVADYISESRPDLEVVDYGVEIISGV